MDSAVIVITSRFDQRAGRTRVDVDLGCTRATSCLDDRLLGLLRTRADIDL